MGLHVGKYLVIGQSMWMCLNTLAVAYRRPLIKKYVCINILNARNVMFSQVTFIEARFQEFLGFSDFVDRLLF
jgi:hypothetical protein